MHTITLYEPVDGKSVTHEFTFPSKWDELATAGHLHAVTWARTTDQNDASMRFALLMQLAGIPTHLMKRMPPAAALTFDTEEDGWCLIPELNWIWKTEPVFEKSLLATIEHEGVTWKGPDDRLDHMTLGQWQYVATLLTVFRACKDDKERDTHLNNWLASLYQPDHCSWSNESIEEYAAKLAKLPIDVKLMAVFNYEALHAHLPLKYPRVFDPDGETGQSPAGLFAIAFDVARSGVLGAIHPDGTGVEKHRVHSVLMYMEHTLHLDHLQQQRMERLRKKEQVG